MLQVRLWALQRPCLRHLHTTGIAKATPVASSSSAKSTAPAKWSPNSIRTGVIAQKRGMAVLWNNQGVRVPVTVLQ
ncbi:hypothetical protein C0992_004433, partial [Termitomyces sp. T32_za158]